MPIAVEMYSLRDHCQTLDGLAASLKRVKAMGYDHIEAAGAKFSTLDTTELQSIRKSLDDLGLTCICSHESLDALTTNTNAVIDKLHILGPKLTAIGGYFPKAPPPETGWSARSWLDFIQRYNDIAAKLAAATPGVRLGYHNHSHEFAPLPTGELPINLMLEHFDKSIFFEFDVYWIAQALADPATWIDKVRNRIPAIHYKDGVPDPDRNPIMMSVGSGHLNWPRINAAARSAAVQYYIAERDQGPEDDFQTLQLSLKNMRKWGL